MRLSKLFQFVFIFSVVLLVGCQGASQLGDNPIDDSKVQVDMKEPDGASDETVNEVVAVKVDTNDDGKADVMVEGNNNNMDVTVDMDAVMDDETKEKIADVSAVEYCVPGETFMYSSDEGNVNSVIIGLENYKGKEFCKANSKTTINSPGGEINTDTTYYFDNTYKEYYVITTVSGKMMPQPQVSEIHLIDGKIV